MSLFMRKKVEKNIEDKSNIRLSTWRKLDQFSNIKSRLLTIKPFKNIFCSEKELIKLKNFDLKKCFKNTINKEKQTLDKLKSTFSLKKENIKEV